MNYFILEMVFMVGLWIAVYMIAKKLPKIFEEVNLSEQKASFFNFRINNDFIDKFDKKAAVMLEKLLRKSRLVIMKLDNFVARHLDNLSIRSKSSASKSQDIIQSVSDKKESQDDSELEN